MSTMILNLTQHDATPDQVEAGVFDPSSNLKTDIRGFLTFDTPPSVAEMRDRALNLCMTIADFLAADGKGTTKVMIGGAPFFMSVLESHLWRFGFTPVYAFSVRESVEKRSEDGTVHKTNVFKHAGFVETPYV